MSASNVVTSGYLDDQAVPESRQPWRLEGVVSGGTGGTLTLATLTDQELASLTDQQLANLTN